MMGGTSIPVVPDFLSKDSKIKELNENLVNKEISVETSKPSMIDEELNELLGEDVLYVFVDTDMNSDSGFFNPNFKCGADYLIELKGKNGRVFDSHYSMYQGSGNDWSWTELGAVDTGSDQHRLETQIDIKKLGLDLDNHDGFFIFYLTRS